MIKDCTKQGDLAKWRGDEYGLIVLFATRLQFRLTNKAQLQNITSTVVTLFSRGAG